MYGVQYSVHEKDNGGQKVTKFILTFFYMDFCIINNNTVLVNVCSKVRFLAKAK